ncbi:hypothetical protein D8674_037159, partial [Pyrus ussuriensis x Pyrus communis]
QHHKESKSTLHDESTIPTKLNVLKLKSKPNELNSNPKVEGYTSHMPYPHRFFLETIKNLEIAIPFLKAIKHIPGYAKFIKELCTNKRMVELNAVVAFGEKVSLVLQRKLPPKEKDPGSFTVPCQIGPMRFDKCLCI